MVSVFGLPGKAAAAKGHFRSSIFVFGLFLKYMQADPIYSCLILTFRARRQTHGAVCVIILSLTVSRLKNRCIPCIFWVTAIFTVVAKYSNLFFPFAFFLNGSHIAFGYELIIRSETTDFMEIIRDKLPSV